jgi:multiple sugar transport system substrate-binding protein
VTLHYWHSNEPSEVEFARQVAEAYHSSQDRVRVELERIPAAGSSEEVLLAAVLSGTTPDICSNVSPSILPRLVRAGALAELTELREHLTARYGEAPPPGPIHHIAWKTNPVMVYANLGLLEAVGREAVPRTYDELRETAKAFRDAYPEKWVMIPSPKMVWWERSFDVYPLFLAATGGATFLDDEGRLTFRSPGGEQALGLLREGFAGRWFPRSPVLRDLFLDGELLFKISGPFYLPKVREQAPPGFRFAVAPIFVPPGGPRAPYTYRDEKDVVVFSSCRHPEAAMDFLRFMTTAERDATFLAVTGQVPLRAGVESLPAARRAIEAEPALEAFCRQATRTRSLDSTIHLVQLFDILSRAYEEASIFGVRSPGEALAEAEARGRHLLETWR